MANQKVAVKSFNESGAYHSRRGSGRCGSGKGSRLSNVSEEPEINQAIRAMRRSYGEIGLTEAIAGAAPEPLFALWLQEAAANPYIVEANAMVLSTFDGNDISSRTVLLKGFDSATGGCTFFTNYNSSKSRAINVNPEVALLFPWYPMERQVIISARIEKISRGESEEYFASRPWSSQIGAWASDQSEEISHRSVLEERWQHFAQLYPEGSTVPLPDKWGGFTAIPHSFEFWQGRYSRLHDRIRFARVSNGTWSRTRLAP